MNELESRISSEQEIKKNLPNIIECEVLKIRNYSKLILDHYKDRKNVDTYMKSDPNLHENTGLYNVINSSYKSWEEIVTTFLKLCKESEEKSKELINQLDKMWWEVKELNKKLIKVVSDKNEIEYEANTDHLTWLSNRRKMEAIIKLLKNNINKTKKWVSIALLDIDDFKKINTDYWLDWWDYVLKKIWLFFRDYFWIDNVYQYFRIWWEEFVIISRTELSIFNEKIKGFLKYISSKNIKINETSNINITLSWWTLSTRNSDWNIKDEDSIRTDLSSRMKKAKIEWKNRIIS